MIHKLIVANDEINQIRKLKKKIRERAEKSEKKKKSENEFIMVNSKQFEK